MENNRIPKQMIACKPRGRSLGRLLKVWYEKVTDHMA
jgi:hypothetical protein